MMLFRRGNRKKSTHRTPLILLLRAPDEGITLDFFLFPRLKSIMKGARFADVACPRDIKCSLNDLFKVLVVMDCIIC
jgi:hypothetical protein